MAVTTLIAALSPVNGATSLAIITGPSSHGFLDLVGGIPPLLWAAAIALVVTTMCVAFAMRTQERRILLALDQFIANLPSTDAIQSEPLSRNDVEGIRTRTLTTEGPQVRWWSRLEQNLQGYQGRAPREGMYLTQPVRETLPESEVIEPLFSSGTFQVFPGLITSIGLAFTFIAILIGLSGVRPDPNVKGAFEGIEGLIGSLGGKFATSIAALLCGALLTLLERRTERRIQKAYDATTQVVAQIFPLLTQTRVLVDLQHSAAEREKALRNISSEVVDQLRDVFSREVSPHLTDGMVGAMKPSFDGMSETLADLEIAIQGMGSLKPMKDLQEQMAVMGKAMMNQFEDVQSQAGSRAAEEVARITTAAQNAEFQIAQLMELLIVRSQDLVQLGAQLEHSGTSLGGLLAGASAAAESMNLAATAFGTTQTELAASVASAQASAAQQQNTLSKLEDLFRQVQAQYEKGGHLLEAYRSTFSSAETQLSRLDQDLGGAFAVVHQGMEAWTQGVDNTMRQLTARTNEHLGGITRSLGAQLENLNENLQEFNDMLSQVVEQRQA